MGKQKQELRQQRDLLATTNQKLHSRHRELIVQQLNSLPRQSKVQSRSFGPHSNVHFSKTSSVFHSQQGLVEWPSQTMPLQVPPGQQDSFSFLSPSKWSDEEADQITVIKQPHLNNFKVRQRSTTEASPDNPPSTSLAIKRSYQKYSRLKRR